jgi:hypothetical protein
VLPLPEHALDAGRGARAAAVAGEGRGGRHQRRVAPCAVAAAAAALAARGVRAHAPPRLPRRAPAPAPACSIRRTRVVSDERRGDGAARRQQAHPSSPIAQGGGFRKTEDQTTTHPIPSRRLSDRSPAATPSWEPEPRTHDPFPEPGNSCGGALAMGDWFESRDGESGGEGLGRRRTTPPELRHATCKRGRLASNSHACLRARVVCRWGGGIGLFMGAWEDGGSLENWSPARQAPMESANQTQRMQIHFELHHLWNNIAVAWILSGVLGERKSTSHGRTC